MNREAFKDEIRLKLTGDVLDLELSDTTLDKIINSSMREIQRYICSVKFISVPYKNCIDLNEVKENDEPIKVSSVTKVYRTEGYVGTGTNTGTGAMDPLYASQWQLLGGVGNLYNFQEYAYNYMSWNTLLQIRNTVSTDMFFKFDKSSNKLYINVATNEPKMVTIEYIPRYDDVSEITSDYWIDILVRFAVALTKITVGRVRSRYTQTGALWTQDGAEILSEGNNELNAIREHLAANTQLVYPVD